MRSASQRRLLGPAALAVVAALAASGPGLRGSLWSQSPVITPQVSIDQDQLQAGKYPLAKVLESGGQFFSTPFLPYDATTDSGDGYGEGKYGPRTLQRKAFYPPAWPDYHFLRLNGLDSQSCFECHNSIGSYVPPGSSAEIRKPGTVAGSAGSNSNAFINSKFPTPLTFLIRQPPHVFGSGYTQTLASEMTGDLAAEVEAARATIQGHPGKSVKVNLQSKGLAFGTFVTTYTGGAARVVGCTEACPNTQPTYGAKGFTDNVKGVTGVACDLVVRPFQWKGISSSIRHFARDALDFHFSMQAVEKYGHLDCDKDGKIDEMTLGNVSALVSFVTMTRPPDQVIPPDQKHQVELGRDIFIGKSADSALQAKLSGQMCATCHMPTLTVDKAQLFIDNPGIANVTQKDCKTLDAGLVTPLAAHQQLEAYRLIQKPLRDARQAAVANADSPAHAMLAAHAEASSTELIKALKQAAAAQPAPPGYTIDLSHPGPGPVPSFSLPRLPAEDDGKVAVPLFSDLRTHNMGIRLQDRGAQGADVADICIPAPIFLTRPLWGVADTGPWLHDGRALTLRDAILMHEGKGSEANPVVAAFKLLSPAEQQSVVDFLLTLHLPIEPDLAPGRSAAMTPAPGAAGSAAGATLAAHAAP
jgi:Di-haem oxidoreductase, putative peroxidase